MLAGVGGWRGWGGRALNKKGRCHVAAEPPIDAMSCAGRGSGTGGKKGGVGGGGGGEVSLCDADDDAISPALWRPMGSAPGDVLSQTLIRWVCVPQGRALIKAVSQYLGCVRTGGL